MSFFGFIILLLIAAICGGIGQSIGGFKLGSGGCLMSAVVGFVGALIGNWIAGELGFPELWTIEIDGEPFPIIWSIVGAALLTAGLGVIFKGKKN
ncbi:MAG: GlsB/YeaQ/YmgE family stress response membrane protein [Balneolaceae bacterium]